MATATITDVLGAVEAALIASPSLGLSLVDGRQGITSATRAHYSVFVRRESTDNLDLYRDQDVARVEDEIAVDLTYRISPKNQRTLPANARKISIRGSGNLLFAYSGTDAQALASGVGYFLDTSQAYEGAPADPPGGARALGGKSVFIQAASGTPTCYVAIE